MKVDVILRAICMLCGVEVFHTLCFKSPGAGFNALDMYLFTIIGVLFLAAVFLQCTKRSNAKSK